VAFGVGASFSVPRQRPSPDPSDRASVGLRLRAVPPGVRGGGRRGARAGRGRRELGRV